MLKLDIEESLNVKNWCLHLRDFLSCLGFYEAWLFREIGNCKISLPLVKQRIKDKVFLMFRY